MTHNRCRYPGCPQKWVIPEPRDRHELKPHYRCTCGRCFTRQGLQLHLSKVTALEKPHPDPPNLKAVFETGRLGPWQETEDMTSGIFEGVSYEDLVDGLKKLPMTWYPGIIKAVITAAIDKNVFLEGRASYYVKTIEEKHGEMLEVQKRIEAELLAEEAKRKEDP